VGFFRFPEPASVDNRVVGKKNATRSKPPDSQSSLPVGRRWPLEVRIAVSIAVAFHVFAVFVGPWAMPQQASPLAADIAAVMRPYIDGLYLSNGYRFFAPEPGPSHLIKYELKLKDGKQITGQFPDRTVNKPRLLYHRYFMLSEFVNTLNNPNPLASSEERVVFKLYVRSYARHLALEYDAEQVKLTQIRHLLPFIDRVREDKIRLDDPRLYEELPLGTFSRSEL
jgi:hypothetical protein